MSKSQFNSFALSDSMIFFIYIGMVLSLVIYNIFLFKVNKKIDHLLYIGFIASTMIAQLALNGWLDVFISIANGWGRYIHLLMGLVGATLLLFIGQFVGVFTQRKQRWFAAVLGLIGLMISLGILSLSPLYTYSNPIMDALALIIFAFVFALTWVRVWDGVQAAKYILWGWAIASPCTILFFLVVTGVVEAFNNYQYLILLASVVEMLSMTHALSTQYRDVFAQSLAAKEKADSEAKVKDKLRILVKSLSHDISNYLSVISGQTQILLLSKDLSEKQQKDLMKILKANDKISGLLKEVRNMQSSEDGKIPVHFESISPNEVFEHVQFTFQERANQKGLDLQFNYIDEGCYIKADKNLAFDHIINNIVSNAIKFSPSSGTICVSVIPHVGSLILRIEDEGRGIKSQQLKNIFDFALSESTPSESGEKGHGFGLPLVKNYMQAMGGQIEIKSPIPGKDCGTRVDLVFQRSTDVINAPHSKAS